MWKIHGKTHGEHLETMGKIWNFNQIFLGKLSLILRDWLDFKGTSTGIDGVYQ
jgi:hypothetical protein